MHVNFLWNSLIQVQEAVANCLPPLVPAIKNDAPGIVKELLRLLLESENFGERKGAAYGLAGMVKGLGILSLKQLDIMTQLQTAIQDKKNFRKREGTSKIYHHPKRRKKIHLQDFSNGKHWKG